MNTMTRIIFFGIFFAITGLVSFYIYIRGLQSIPPDSSLRIPYTIAFWTIAVSFIGGRVLENVLPVILADLLIWMGSFWLGAMLYFLLAVVCLDVLRLVNHFLPIFPRIVADHYVQAKYLASLGVLGLVGALLLGGHINSTLPRVKELNLRVAKGSAKIDSLNVVAVSDIHLGTIVGRYRIEHIVKMINSLNPDLVLLPGDIVDEDLKPVIRNNVGAALLNIRSRFGVYAATGNHEYIGGVEQACDYLTKHNIVMLRDESAKIADSVFLVGREDLSANRFGGKQRKDLKELMAGVEPDYPVILMDHQPWDLAQVSGQGVDLQISGHTHDGQLWPLNYVVNSIYELPWGYKKIGDTHFYVSDGAGTWGPPLRIGNRPEIVHIHLILQ